MRTNGSRVSFLVVAALCAATTLWGMISSAQNVTFVRAPRPAGSSSRRPAENHATELRDCISQAYGRGTVQLGQPLQQGLSAGDFRRRFDATPRCGRVGWREALAQAIESGLVDGGGSGGGSIQRVPPPPPLGAPPPIGSPVAGSAATQQQVQAAIAGGHPPVIIEVRPDAGAAEATVVDAGPPVVAPPRPPRCTNCARDAGTDTHG